MCSVMSDSLQLPQTVAHQAPLSMEFSRQEYWEWEAISYSRGSRKLGIFPMQRPESLASPALAGGLFTTSATWEAPQGMVSAPITATQEEATTQQGQGQKSLQSQGLCCSAQRPPSPCPLAHPSHLKSASAPGPALSSLRGMSSAGRTSPQTQFQRC